MPDFGAELKRRRTSVGMSLTGLAAAVHFTKGYLSKVENGKARVNRELAKACDVALGADGALLSLVTEAGTPARRSAGGIAGLPHAGRYFVGRETELDALSARLLDPDDARVGVVHGMAGAGKTALAVAAARRVERSFPDGCLFFDLRGHTPGAAELSAGEALGRLLRLLDVSADQLPADEDGLANLVRDQLRGRRMILVLDNVRSAEQIRAIVPGETSSRILVTSRGRLPALDDAWHFPVDVLPLPDAVRLLRSVAGSHAPDDEGVATEIVRHCGQLPLAVRIVAARFVAGGWTAARLRDRLADETTRLGTLDDGERSVATAFTVSYESLPGDQRRLLGLLALHPATAAEIAAVEALAGLGPGEADRLVDRLHDAHLVVRDERGYVELHDLMRMFASTHALPGVEPEDRSSAMGRLVDHALATTVAADELAEPYRFRPPTGLPAASGVPFTDADGALTWLAAQWPTLVEIVDSAFRHGFHDRCWQLAFVLRAFFFREKLFEPWIRTHERALEATRAIGDLSATGMILNNLGMAHVESGRVDEAIGFHERAQECFAQARDDRGAIDALSSLAWARLYRGEAEATLTDLTTVLAVYRRTGRTRNVVIALRGIALASTVLGRFPAALASAQEAVQLAQLPVDRAMSVNCEAWVRFRAAQWADAESGYRRAAELADDAGSEYERARALTGLGNTAAARGDRQGAARRWTEAAAYRVTLDPRVLGEAEYRDRAAVA
ncbi:Helix-turn-helix domain-containing protein [Amycolatopsis pretoriensis]|uniref:Helix-turn-helix domain-containing protein n=1 Tax=Amycolatopsis pretoriensis TaxID=218821 RepID=A0A1H5QTY1_9PSEU|nr:helix-turn-helix domain-containing protein [Amycolatopsis pretoriensis]SEF29525.1 Helix-turn-helix domain-containing protein [Amycolatopsis pretoriensis]